MIYVSSPTSIDLLCFLIIFPHTSLLFHISSSCSVLSNLLLLHVPPSTSLSSSANIQPPPPAPKMRSPTPGMTLSSCYTILLLHFLPINKKSPTVLQTHKRCVTSIKEDLKRTTKRPIRLNRIVKKAMRNENHPLKSQCHSYRRKRV